MQLMTDDERARYMEFIIEQLKPSSVLHPGTGKILFDLYQEHKRDEEMNRGVGPNS